MAETLGLFDDIPGQDLRLKEAVRIAEALIFASREPLAEAEIASRLPPSTDVAEALRLLQAHYAGRGVTLVKVAGRWMFRTAEDLGWLLSRDLAETRKPSRAAIETLAIIAYHQPVTRAEIEEIRGVAMSKGTMDVLLEARWVRLRGRRRTPGRPLTYGTTPEFLVHFGLDSVADLPGLEDLRGTSLFEGHLPRGFTVPVPRDDVGLGPDEDPVEDGETEAFGDEDDPADSPGAAAGGRG